MASTGSSSSPDDTIDCRGLRCPLPVLKTEKRLAAMPAGSTLTVLATDPMAKIDIPLFCRQRGHGCEVTEAEGVMIFTLTRGA
jgi:tRNA 2-thiouridine synthesizing protein A